MPRPREYDDALRIRLVEAAARLLVDEGPAAVTTRRVAAAVGTSTTAIYTLIGSKNDLGRAVCVEGFARLGAHLATVTPSEDPLHDLVRLGVAYLDMALESPDLYRTMFGHGLAHDHDGCDDADRDDEVGLDTLATLVAAVGRAVDAGRLAGDPSDLALQLWSLSHGVASLAVTGRFGPPDAARAVFTRAGTALVAGLAAQVEAGHGA